MINNVIEAAHVRPSVFKLAPHDR